MTAPRAHRGDDFCLIHGRNHMVQDPGWGSIPYCDRCETERQDLLQEQAVEEILAASDTAILASVARDKADPPRCGNCEFFDNGTMGPDGLGDCLNGLSESFQTYSHQHCGLWQRSS